MSIDKIILIALFILIVFVIVKFLAKRILQIILIIFLALLCFLGYRYLSQDFQDKEFLLLELEDKYCTNPEDSVYCDCIVRPLLAYINENMDSTDLKRANKNPLFELVAAGRAVRKNKEEIRNCLRDKEANLIWDMFIDEVKQKGKKEINEFLGFGKKD